MGEFQVGDKVRWIDMSADEIAAYIEPYVGYVDVQSLETMTGIIQEDAVFNDDVFYVKWATATTEFIFCCHEDRLELISRPTIGKDRYKKTLFDLED